MSSADSPGVPDSDKSRFRLILEQLLETGGRIPGTLYPIIDTSADTGPAGQLTRVLLAAVGGIVLRITTGLAEIPLSIARALTGVWDVVLNILTGTRESRFENPFQPAETAPGIFDVIVDAFSAVTVDVWAIPLEQYGILGLPVSVGIALATLYIASQGVRRALLILAGEEGIL